MIPPRVRDLVWERAGEMCEKCGKGLVRGAYLNNEIHHRKYLSRGGPDTVDNLVLLCLQPCHAEIHRENLPGFAVASTDNPQLIPIRHWSGRDLYLLPDGNYGEEVWAA
jgi:hypothetical protein